MMEIFDYLQDQASFRNLEPPCGYKGGKRRFASEIMSHLKQRHPDPTRFYDLCCGSGSVFLRALEWGWVKPSQVTCVDAGYWGVFWAAVSDGSLDVDLIENLLLDQRPSDPTKVEEWLLTDVALRDPSPETFIVLQAAAWGGNAVWWDDEGQGWMQGEGQRKFRPRSYWEPGPNSPETQPRHTIFRPGSVVERVRHVFDALSCQGMDARHARVEDLGEVVEGSVLYLDPPYADTSGYGVSLALQNAIGTLRAQGSSGLYVSEGGAVEGADEIWRLTGRKRASLNGSSRSTTEADEANEEWLSFFSPS